MRMAGTSGFRMTLCELHCAMQMACRSSPSLLDIRSSQTRLVKSAVAETCWFALSAAQVICADADLYAPLETGGVLMGYFAAKAAVVTHAVLGGHSATRTAFSFEPDYEFQQLEIDRIYEQSGRVSTY